MIEYETKLKSWGNSIGVIVPKEKITQENLKENQVVRVMLYKKKMLRVKDIFGKLKLWKKPTKQIMKEVRKDLDSGFLRWFLLKYFFDTYAIIEIVKENKNYKAYFDKEIITSILNIGELYYALLKDFDEKTAIFWLSKLRDYSLSVDLDVVVKAMKFKFKNKDRNFSFIDCVGYVLARANGFIFLTGDKEFEGLDGVEFVKWLFLYNSFKI